ncbi:hypothetical protein CROQUDRAFT_52958 [Cronartium quercuum f. sp. fusiforme G11]|uniref:aspartate kinase n=1 Tax=Cronartium quercuum f. sp. fusiforme G11 TaxID=708437 RepID=A0A9P6N6L8_9BASI|nr:hypothetical protein CROQUDRAFT_52958 [Cronartium quercuum f. sp. fusiforme G11]
MTEQSSHASGPIETAAIPDHQALRTNPVADVDHHPKWVVQKYGGTSVGKCLLNIPKLILPASLDAGYRVAIVCSARSGDTKTTGTTNMLLQAALEALQPPVIPASPTTRSITRPTTPGSSRGDGFNPLILNQILQRGNSTPRLSRANSATPGCSSPIVTGFGSVGPSPEAVGLNPSRFDQTIEKIKLDHLAAAKALITNSDLMDELELDITYDCDRLRSLLLAAQILEEISPRSKDLIIGVGEKLSCRIVTACLIDQGFDAELICLDSIVDKSDLQWADEEGLSLGPGGQLRQPFYDRLASKLGDRLLQCENRIPVITGFFGVVPGSLLSQIGRGYTDLCAALCAVGLRANELQVWKEVDGIFTADPRKVPRARLLSVVSPEEAAELTYYGSEVIHPFTMEQAIRASIPIRIKNVMNPTGLGTVIYPLLSDPSSPTLSIAGTEAALASSPSHDRSPTAVTIKDTIIVLNIHSNRKTISHGFFARIFGILDKFGIVVDLISTSEVHVSMAMKFSETFQARGGGLDKLVNELKDIGEVSILKEMAILSLVGKQMKNMVGIAGKMFSTLAQGNVNIEMISQGASEINISCVISNRDSAKALNLVHDKLLSEPDL